MNNIFLSIVLPAYNEQRRIGLTLTHMQAYLSRQAYDSEVIVVDDGSQDGTSGAHDWLFIAPSCRF